MPFSERHPSLGRPVYVRLLNVLLAKCELPAGFVSWSTYTGDNFDEDAITELREGAQVKFVVCSYSSRFGFFLLRRVCFACFPVRHVCCVTDDKPSATGRSSSLFVVLVIVEVFHFVVPGAKRVCFKFLWQQCRNLFCTKCVVSSWSLFILEYGFFSNRIMFPPQCMHALKSILLFVYGTGRLRYSFSAAVSFVSRINK